MREGAHMIPTTRPMDLQAPAKMLRCIEVDLSPPDETAGEGIKVRLLAASRALQRMIDDICHNPAILKEHT